MRSPSAPASARFDTVRPLVRYVDADQAVIEVPFTLAPALPPAKPRHPANLAVLVQISGEDGFNDELIFQLPSRLPDLHAAHHPPQLTILRPDRWWPAGLGEQPLYRMRLTLLADEDVADVWSASFGLTSIRANPRHGREILLVNGREHEIHGVVVIDRIDERRLLPAAGDSVLLVRDHYGTDLLYQAADRAGILMIQCVPIHAQAAPHADVLAQVQRLVHHPCLAGWFVGHLGPLADDVARAIRRLDPTRAVFSGIGEKPHIWAA
jgi:hypothetical protein